MLQRVKSDPALNQAEVPGLAQASDRPWETSFLTLMRRISASRTDLPGVGQALRPQEECFRLGQQGEMRSAPREVASVSQRGELDIIRLYSLGMLGAQGVLPLHVTEIARERREAHQDQTLDDFLDIFHHRAFSLFYRAWEQSQAAAGLDRDFDERFTRYIAWLGGDEPTEVGESHLPEHARWASAAHRAREARNPEGLIATLQRFFGVPVRLEEYNLHWIAVATEDQCALGYARQGSVLGQGAILGENVPDRQGKFRLVIGPLDLRPYLRFTPQGVDGERDLPTLIEFVRAFVGFEYVWDMQLLVRSGAAPSVRLGDGQCLGWSTWMGESRKDEAVVGLLCEPEAYHLLVDH